MHSARILAVLGCVSLGMYALTAAAAGRGLDSLMLERLGDRRMKNVVVSHMSAPETNMTPIKSVHTEAPNEPEDSDNGKLPAWEELELYMPEMEPMYSDEKPAPEEAAEEELILETTIEGGLSIKNDTQYWVDAAEILRDGPGLSLDAYEPHILIIHTHSSEAYTQAGLDRYEPSDKHRTENTEFNIVRIGDELTEIFQQNGLNVIHDRGIYDYPSYTGSYTRSGQSVEQYLRDYPSIKLVLDIHRDALGSDDVVYKTMAEEDGVCASQVMLLVGTDESGLEHPGWRQNLAAALYLQNAVNLRYPTLMRPVSLVQQRYNQHLSPGSMILEVGSSGNTLQEALAAVRLFGAATAPALAELIEQ